MYGFYEWIGLDGRMPDKASKTSDRVADLIPNYAGSHWVIVTTGDFANFGPIYQVVRASSDWAKERFFQSKRLHGVKP